MLELRLFSSASAGVAAGSVTAGFADEALISAGGLVGYEALVAGARERKLVRTDARTGEAIVMSGFWLVALV